MFAVSSYAALAPKLHQRRRPIRWKSLQRILLDGQYITGIHSSNIFGKSCTGPPNQRFRTTARPLWRDSQASQTSTLLAEREWFERPGDRGVQDRSECSWSLRCGLSQIPSGYVDTDLYNETLFDVHAIALIQAIDFYMDEERSVEREEIIRLSNDRVSPSAEVNNKLMAYIREAQSEFVPLTTQNANSSDVILPD